MIFIILLIGKRYCAYHAGVCGSGDVSDIFFVLALDGSEC